MCTAETLPGGPKNTSMIQILSKEYWKNRSMLPPPCPFPPPRIKETFFLSVPLHIWRKILVP